MGVDLLGEIDAGVDIVDSSWEHCDGLLDIVSGWNFHLT